MINLEQDQGSLYHGGGGSIVIAFVQPQLSPLRHYKLVTKIFLKNNMKNVLNYVMDNVVKV